MAKKKRLIHPICDICGKKQIASSKLAWTKGMYACGCNSFDYMSVTKYRKKNPIADKDCYWMRENEAIRLTINGNPGIKKNSQVITKFGILPSLHYRVWAARALKDLSDQWKIYNRKTIKTLVWLEVKYFLDSFRRTDLSNLYEGTQDCLTTVGVWQDDSLVMAHDGSRKYYKEKRPRTEIIIRKFKTD